MTEPAEPPLSGLPGALFLLAGLVTGLLAGVVDVMFVPLYVGSTPLYLAVLITVVGNVVLPLVGIAASGRTVGGVMPLLGWLAVVVVLSTSRPEGDVLLPGGTSLQYVTYGMLLGGVLAGIVTVAVAATRRAQPLR